MNSTGAFEQHRRYLFGVAYRMLGSVADAEDVVQDAWLRWRGADEQAERPRAFLTTVVTRLSIDRLRTLKARRETYYGPWLPDPVITGTPDATELRDGVSMALLVLLETLNPIERAVFVLREVLDYEFAEIANVVERTETNCRQILSRARSHVRRRNTRFEASPERSHEFVQRFLDTFSRGDVRELANVLHDDVVLYADGGGKALSATVPMEGCDRVARFLAGISAKSPYGGTFDIASVNGEPGVLFFQDGQLETVAVFEIESGRVAALRFVRNPDKLAHLQRRPRFAGTSERNIS